MSDEGCSREVEKEGASCWRKYLKYVGEWFKYKDKGEWLKEMQNGLSMSASIIATMTFQLATNPPGGVVQASNNDKALLQCNYTTPCPGESVIAFTDPDNYSRFFIANTISFVASISVCLMLVSGIPLNHRFPTWLLSIGMCVAVTSLVITYMFAAFMVTPNSSVWDTFYYLYQTGVVVWLCLLAIVVLFLIIRLCVWGLNKMLPQSKKQII